MWPEVNWVLLLLKPQTQGDEEAGGCPGSYTLSGYVNISFAQCLYPHMRINLFSSFKRIFSPQPLKDFQTKLATEFESGNSR